MARRPADGLLGPDDPVPFEVFNAAGKSPFLLIGDHAGAAVPRILGNLGVAPSEMDRHIAIDIGVREMGKALARLLDAPFVHQVYSRLVIDCNRAPARDDAVPIVSDGTCISRNENLTDAARTARIEAIHTPYHRAIAALIDARAAADRPTILLSLHSFTPRIDGIDRHWDVGILHWLGNTAFAHALRDALTENDDIIVGDNVPYCMDETDYTVPFHAFGRGIGYAEIEVRQDLIGDPDGRHSWAVRLSQAARRASTQLDGF